MRFSKNRLDNITPNSILAWQFILDFLSRKGYSYEKLHVLPHTLQRDLMAGASTYASLKLAEIEARSNLRQKIHTI